MLSFENGIKTFASDGNVSWPYSIDVRKREERRQSRRKVRAAFFGIGRVLVVFNV